MLQINGYVRALAFVIVLAVLIGGYWWLTIMLAIAFLFIIPTYYEILFFGSMYDALYGLSLAQFGGFSYIFTIAAFVLFLMTLFVKKILSAYEPTL